MDGRRRPPEQQTTAIAMVHSTPYRTLGLLSLGLFFSTSILYWPATQYGFLSFDDGGYVYENPHVTSGLTSDGLRWSLTTGEQANWHPLTWLSLQLDQAVHGANASGYHLTNLALHAISSVLLLWCLTFFTAAAYRSALVAAFFAFHPLHVESVAWVAERKDVLSGVFWLLTMLAYGRYAQRPCISRYLLVALLFALGLASKPMLVTLPCVLLLLDFWPLKRWPRRDPETASADVRSSQKGPYFSTASLGWLILEKLPLLALSAAASALTFVAQEHGGAMDAMLDLPLPTRLGNALVGYVIYLVQIFWPLNLAAFYPHPGQGLPTWQPVAAGLLLLAITFATVRTSRRNPHLLVGWLWYLGTLVPVIGVVQVGEQAHADRYTYLPSIGLFIALVWQAAATAQWLRLPKAIAVSTAAVCLVACGILTSQQIRYWRDDCALWEHAVAVTHDNYFASANLAQAYLEQGDVAAAERNARESLRIRATAVPHVVLGNIHLRQRRLQDAAGQYKQAIRLAPHLADAYNNLGTVMAMQGELGDAVKLYSKAAQLKPSYALAHNNLGLALAEQGKLAEAIRSFSAALQCDPVYAEAYDNRGNVFFYQEDWPAARSDYQRAVHLQPDLARCRYNLGAVLWEMKAVDEARREYRKALELDPAWPARAADRAWALATQKDAPWVPPAKPLQLAKQACEATDPATPPQFLDILGAAYANAGRFDRAAIMARRALAAIEPMQQPQYADQVGQRLRLYESKQPFRDSRVGQP